jgi:hypothetical protein
VCLGALAALAVGVVLPVDPLRAQTATRPELADYAVLGLAGVVIRHESRVLSGAVGAVEGTVRLGRQARVTNVVAGPTVRLGPDTRTGTLFCHLVNGPPPLPSCTAFTDPLLDPALLTSVPVVPGTTPLRVPAHTGTAPVPAGSFGDVRVGPGSTLQLYGGTYAMASLRIGRRARVICASDCRIGVLGTVLVRRGAELGAASPVRADTVRVDVAAAGPLVFVARPRANVSATIFAPAGDVVLGPFGAYRGAFIGRTVVVASFTTVRGDSAL